MENIQDVIANLSPAGRALLDAQTSRVTLEAGETLFLAGAQGSAFYLLETGSLGAFAGAPPELRLLGTIRPGETVGEMALIAGAPRSATVIALRDCELLRMTSQGLDYLLTEHPAFAAGLVKLLVARLQELNSGSGATPEPRNVALLPANPACDNLVEQLAWEICAQLRACGSTICALSRQTGEGKPRAWFDAKERAHDYTILTCRSSDGDWFRQCARQADRIFVVGRGGSETADLSQVRTELSQRGQHQLLDLFLMHEADTPQPRATAAWLTQAPFKRHFHIRAGNADDMARLARIVRGAGVGLVLSGGGARAYAHIGIIEVLRAHGVPIDFVGGTSMGAIIAACVASGWDDQAIEARVRAAFVESNPLSDYTVPAVSMVKGDKVQRLLTEHFGADRTIEDLWLPFYCVSTNLTTGQAHRHWSGGLVDALRATIALPGVLPPIVLPEGVLVDGGATNNLPVLAMRALHRGPVIAVDVARETALHPQAFAQELSQPLHQRVRRLPIVNVLMRSATVASETGDRREAKAADVVLTPQLGTIEIRSWGAYDEAVEAGRSHAQAMLAEEPELAALAGDCPAQLCVARPGSGQVSRPPRTNEASSPAPVTGSEQLVPTQT